MKRILPYKLFESKSKVDEKEFESTVTDIFSDFIDEYNLSMHFDWGWVVDNDFRKDSEMSLMLLLVALMRNLDTVYIKDT